VLKAINNPIVLDIGAHSGTYSNKVKSLSPSAEIYAFEPHPRSFERLQSEALRWGYTAINLGCGAKAGYVDLFDYADNDQGSQHASLYRDVIQTIHNASSSARQIQITSLDSFVEQKGIRRVNLLKIDTEGNELNVLVGARKSIESQLIDIIHFEFNEMNAVSHVFFRDFYMLLPQYEFHRMLPDGLVPLGSYSPLLCEIFAYQNIVAIRQGSNLNLEGI
jgi:FkbM family methyltransferase